MVTLLLLKLTITYLINCLVCKTCLSLFPGHQGDTFECLVLYNQLSKTQRCSIFIYIKQKSSKSSHLGKLNLGNFLQFWLKNYLSSCTNELSVKQLFSN